MSNIPKHLLNSKLITDEEWEEYQDLKERVRMYEDPDDLTLFYMWLDEKAKDKMTDLRIKLSAREEVANEYKERIDSAIACINGYKKLVGMTGKLVYNLLNILNGENDKSKGE